MGLGVAGFMGAFFTVHYGGFCAGHGLFLLLLLGMSSNSGADISPEIGPEVVSQTITSHSLAPFIALIVLWQLAVFLWEFCYRKGYEKTTPGEEMFAPYGRIIVLHVGIFAGAFALIQFGEPMIGVLALILLRSAFGIFANLRSKRRKTMEAG